MTLKDRHKERTREQLVEAAAELFLARGFSETTIEDVAAAVEVSPRTVHRYFATKEDLFLAQSESSWASFLDALRACPATLSPLAAVKAATRTAFGPSWADAPRVRAFVRLLEGTPALQARSGLQSHGFQADLAEVLAERAGRRAATVDDLVTAAAVAATIGTALRAWAHRGDERPLSATVDRALAVLSRPVLPS